LVGSGASPHHNRRPQASPLRLRHSPNTIPARLTQQTSASGGRLASCS
jgi:hypothetical protein